MLLGSKIDSDCWSDAMLYFACLKNSLPYQSLKNVSPCESWTNNRLYLSLLRVFFSILHAKKPGVRRGKLDTSLIIRGILLGYRPTSRNATHNKK